MLAYHRYGENKYKLLGRNYEMNGTEELSEEFVEKFKTIVENNGFECIIGG